MIPTYDIKAFHWNPKTRTFSQDAWNLEWMDEEYHITAFPNGKNPFYIKNYKTGESRLFSLIDENTSVWYFKNEEEDIVCEIYIVPF